MDWAKKLVQDLDEYVGNCMESVDSEEDYETVTGQFYCGYLECYHRETISFLIPKIIEAYKAGILEEES
jgi:hypothetical protein